MDNLTSYKLTLLFIFAIVVPSTLLSIFSLAAISHERDLHRAQIEKRYREGVEEVAAALEKRLFGPQADLEKAVAAAAQGVTSLRDLAEPVRALAGAGRLFRAAALVDPAGAVLAAPLALRDAKPPAMAFASLPARDDATARRLLHPAELDEIFLSAEKLELQARDDRAALEAIEEIARRHDDDDQVRLEALVAKGRLYAKIERFPENAYDALDEIVRRYPLARDRTGAIPALAARIDIAAIYGASGKDAAETRVLEDALRFIAFYEPEIGRPAAAFYRDRALERLRAKSPELASRAVREAEGIRQDREASRAFVAALGASPLLAGRLRTLAARPPGPSGYVADRDARTVVFWAAVPRLGLAVFDVDVDGLRAHELEALAATETAHDEGFFRLADRGAPASAAVEPGAAEELARKRERVDSSPSPEGEELARRPLRFPLDTLDIVALRRDPTAHDRLARIGDRVYSWAIALALVGLAIGAFVMTRAVRKEMKASMLKSDFVTTVTHELKTPLTSIGMFAETLLMGRVSDKAEEKECLEIIAKETDRLTRLIDRVLTFSKIEARKKRFDLKLTDIPHLVEETIEIFKTQMRGAPRPFVVDLTAVQDIPKVLADRASIQEVLLNLLSNAYKYGGEPRKIQVTMTKRRRWVLVEVRDWGIGIPWREQRKIFRKFYRANDVLTRDVEGSGIGLTLARSIALAHRGDITVRSKVQAGSTFTLWLPR